MTNKDLKTIGALAAIGTIVVGAHGITSKRWKDAHTVLAVIGGLVTVATL